MSHWWRYMLSAAVLVFAAGAARAEWPTDPTVNLPICTAPGVQNNVIAVGDGAGGAILCWADQRTGMTDLFAQRVSATGEIMWTQDGILISTAPGNVFEKSMIPDGAGGIIVAWVDGRTPFTDIYAQRLDADGVPQWASGGVALCTAAYNQSNVMLASDGAHGAIAVWQDARNGLDYHLFAQRIDGAGTPLWAHDGVSIPHPFHPALPKIVADGFGGAIVVWVSLASDGVSDLFAQRLDAQGMALWADNGAPVADGPSTVYRFDVIPDGTGGAMIVFSDDRNGLLDGFAQKLDAHGARQWPEEGLSVCTASGHQDNPLIVSDGAGGVVLTWGIDFRNDYQLFAQRVTSDGALPWQDGVPLVNRSDQFSPAIASDGLGGAWIVWSDLTVAHDIYAQRVTGVGAPEWGDAGLLVCGAPEAQTYPAIVSNGEGGAIIAWTDERDWPETDIYAQRVPFDSPCTLTVDFDLHPNTFQLNSMGRWITGRITPPSPYSPSDIDITSIRLNDTVPVDPTAPVNVGGRDLAVRFDRYLVLATVAPGDSVLQVRVTGTIGEECFTGVDVIRVIRVPVTAPAGGTVVAHGQPTSIRWDTPLGVAPIWVAVLASFDDGQGWNLIARDLPNTGVYEWYPPEAMVSKARVAVVLVEKELPEDEIEGALGVSDRFSIGSTTDVGSAVPGFALEGAMPQPARRTLRLGFSLPDTRPATISVFDLAGRLVWSREVGELGTGRHVVEVGEGTALPTGVYLVRLQRAGQALNSRAVVLR